MKLYTYEREHLLKIRKHLAECTVLLKCDGKFPLDKPGKIAAYGNGVRNTIKGGTGSGEVNSRFFVNVEEGLTNAGFEITSSDWLDKYQLIYDSAFEHFVKNLRKEAKENKTDFFSYSMGAIMKEPEYELPLDAEGDSAIYVLSRISGEGADRKPEKGDILLTDTEIDTITKLAEKYDRFMLVLNVGGVVDLSPVVDKVGNILYMSQLGVESGNCLAAILLGKMNPSGKLTTTWAAWQEYCEDIDFGNKDDTYYNEGIYVGYRYFDTAGKKALFPFGYGMSYTAFVITDTKVSCKKSEMTVTAKVTNTGRTFGKEVVQVYITSPESELKSAYQSLAGFAKTKTLKPGEEETVQIKINLNDISEFSEELSAYILSKGEYIVRVGNSSVDTVVAATVSLDDTVILKKVREILPDTSLDFWEKIYKRPEIIVPAGTPVIKLSASDFETVEVEYDKPGKILREVKKYTIEELALLNIGAFSKGGQLLSIIGNAGKKVAGAAGESATIDGKVLPIVMADGPAGLRLARRYYVDKKGVHGIGDSFIPDSLLKHMPQPEKFMMELTSGRRNIPKDAVIEHQYATALPIGTAIAQSFNLEFAELCGDIVGSEMERFGVNLWLAPALNIHRSIRCGRNFEYYSEDPVVSGYFAAAITKGVQKHKRCGVTIKHFAGNNQETNRVKNNSHMSERTAREIYLRGFEICVREANPVAVMTSYNLINGIHTSENSGLTEDFLRDENNYEGLVMTDWVIVTEIISKNDKYRNAISDEACIAGNNLFMPGGKKDYDRIIDAVKEGRITRRKLEVSASRVIRFAKKLNM